MIAKGPYILCCMVFMMASTMVTHAQQRYQRWGGGVDDEKLHFGFSFHYIQADYKFNLKNNWRDMGYTKVESPFSYSPGLGLLADLKLTENLNLRFQPNLRFMNIDVNIYEGTGDGENKLLERGDYEPEVHRSDIGLPLLVKFKSDRKTNVRGYLIGGGEIALNVAPSKRYESNRKDNIMTNRNYFAYTAGIGFDIYFEYFKMSPELRWTQSIGNLLDMHPRNDFNVNISPLERLYMRSFQFSLYFE